MPQPFLRNRRSDLREDEGINMPLVSKGSVYLWSKNDEILLVEKMDLETRTGEETSKITFHATNLEDKKRWKIAAEVDSNLLHDLVEFSDLDTRDVFLVKQTGEGKLVYGTYPKEEWKHRLEKLREKK